MPRRLKIVIFGSHSLQGTRYLIPQGRWVKQGLGTHVTRLAGDGARPGAYRCWPHLLLSSAGLCYLLLGHQVDRQARWPTQTLRQWQAAHAPPGESLLPLTWGLPVLAKPLLWACPCLGSALVSSSKHTELGFFPIFSKIHSYNLL